MSQYIDPVAVLKPRLDIWHRFVETKDPALLDELLADDVVFRSPFVHTPTEGKEGTALILRTVITVFQDFRYHRTFCAGTSDVTLEFSARVGDLQLKGVDLVHFDEDGKITDFEVMVRPAKALQALGEAMGRKIGPELARLKGKMSAI